MTDDTPTQNRVLLVEDEAMIAMLLEAMLVDFGCTVAATAGQFDEALALARTAGFDFAIVDVNLRGVEAYPVARALRERDTPFAFVTGYGSAGTDPAFSDVPVLQK